MNNQQVSGRGYFEVCPAARWIALLLLVSSVVVGCGDGDRMTPARTATASAEPSSDYTLKVLVGPPGNQHQVRIHPADLSLAERTAHGWAPGRPATQAAPVRPGLHTLAGVDNGSGSPVDTVAEDEKQGYASGWTLLLWAARSCYKKNDPASGPLQSALEAPDEHGVPDHKFYIFYDLSPLGSSIRGCSPRKRSRAPRTVSLRSVIASGPSPGIHTRLMAGH